jgi:electron transfer flavoprotein beta subunit
LEHAGPFATARVLAEAVRGEGADLILTGLQSDDYGFAQTGVILAELLGLPHATIVIEVDYSGEELRVKRELESGWYQWYTMPTPALLTIQSGISQIRYATLKGIMAAKKKEIREVQPDAAALEGAGEFQSVTRIYLPQKTKQTQFLGDGDAKRGAAQLAEKLRTEARVF